MKLPVTKVKKYNDGIKFIDTRFQVSMIKNKIIISTVVLLVIIDLTYEHFNNVVTRGNKVNPQRIWKRMKHTLNRVLVIPISYYPGDYRIEMGSVDQKLSNLMSAGNKRR